MTFAMIIRTAFELSAIILLLVGLLNEKKVIAFENKLFRAIRINYRNYRRRKAHEAAVKRGLGQKRAPAADREATARVSVVRCKKSRSQVA